MAGGYRYINGIGNRAIGWDVYQLADVACAIGRAGRASRHQVELDPRLPASADAVEVEIGQVDRARGEARLVATLGLDFALEEVLLGEEARRVEARADLVELRGRRDRVGRPQIERVTRADAIEALLTKRGIRVFRSQAERSVVLQAKVPADDAATRAVLDFIGSNAPLAQTTHRKISTTPEDIAAIDELRRAVLEQRSDNSPARYGDAALERPSGSGDAHPRAGSDNGPPVG